MPRLVKNSTVRGKFSSLPRPVKKKAWPMTSRVARGARKASAPNTLSPKRMGGRKVELSVIRTSCARWRVVGPLDAVRGGRVSVPIAARAQAMEALGQAAPTDAQSRAVEIADGRVERDLEPRGLGESEL